MWNTCCLLRRSEGSLPPCGYHCGTKVVRSHGPHLLHVSRVRPALLSPRCTLLPSTAFSTIYRCPLPTTLSGPFSSYCLLDHTLFLSKAFQSPFPFLLGWTHPQIEVRTIACCYICSLFQSQLPSFFETDALAAFLLPATPSKGQEKKVDHVVWVGWWSMEPSTTAPPSTSRFPILKCPTSPSLSYNAHHNVKTLPWLFLERVRGWGAPTCLSTHRHHITGTLAPSQLVLLAVRLHR